MLVRLIYAFCSLLFVNLAFADSEDSSDNDSLKEVYSSENQGEGMQSTNIHIAE